jgi:hypothetical protein
MQTLNTTNKPVLLSLTPAGAVAQSIAVALWVRMCSALVTFEGEITPREAGIAGVWRVGFTVAYGKSWADRRRSRDRSRNENGR